MRRTEQEFKAEVLRRSQTYRQERTRTRKKLLGVGLCVCLCFAVLAVFAPMGGASSDNAAPAADMLAVGGTKFGASMSQSPECAPEYAMDGAAPMEEEPAAGQSDETTEAGPAAVKIICGIEEITLDASDSAVIMDYLSSDQWIPAAANCLCDYTFHVNGETYRYHSDCGTIQDEAGRSLTLSEADKAIFNNIVGRCPMRID